MTKTTNKRKSSNKISKIKSNNQKRNKLAKKGKLKPKKKIVKNNNNKQTTINEPVNKFKNPDEEETEEESDHGEGMVEMMDVDDLEFLKNAVANKSYRLFTNVGVKDTKNIKPAANGVPDDLEQQYEKQMENEEQKTKSLLPIKTKQGLITRTMDAPEDDLNFGNNEIDDDLNFELIDEEENDPERLETVKPITTADLFVWRKQMLEKRKYDIGVLCSDMLENPEGKIVNLKKLLQYMDEKHPELRITMTKLTALSLLEVFKDIIPSYPINVTEQSGVQLKRETIKLQSFELGLLKGYKMYLQKLERLAKVYNPKKGDSSVRTESKFQMGEIAIQCFCDLLNTHPYFNYAKNLAQMLVTYLDVGRENIRSICQEALGKVIKNDKRGEITLNIVLAINSLIKKRSHCVHPEVLRVLLNLNIKEVNLDKEKEDELKGKKLNDRKQRLFFMSNKERKRNKNLEKLEKELRETKGEENQKKKHKILTDITKICFTIYFRILKDNPSSKLLSATLEGLAKFSPCINLDFYHDLVNVLDNLMIENTIGPREQLHCVQTVFTILSGHGEILNIDPFRFYTHLYRNMYHVYADKNDDEIRIILKTIELIMTKHSRKISQPRLLAFTKRLCNLCLQTLHNGSLGSLTIIKSILQLNKSADILLDADSTVGQGVYLPEIQEPEYCNASSTALWELSFLKRHYHPYVCQLANYVANGVPVAGTARMSPELLKLSPIDMFEEFSPDEMAFKPAIKPPAVANQNLSKKTTKTNFKDQELKKYVYDIFENYPKNVLLEN